ncbi:MAG: methyltransferase [Bacteroides sp.]|nr:methyltransferase [Ruminococcus flavefaciens]MCM1554736.1 methyltransferase [Bacteroides sp.]
MPEFGFKRFSVSHGQSTMKVGTDAVLLGAWADLPRSDAGAVKVLEIGCGCGVVSLMLAQRMQAEAGPGNLRITALDIHAPSCEEARHNVQQSPWHTQICVEHLDFLQYPETEKFHLIVSNPPFFSESLKSPEAARNLARHNDSLPFDALLRKSEGLLLEEGRLAMILPLSAFEKIQALVMKTASLLRLERLARVYSKPGKPCERVLCAWRKTHSEREAESPQEITLFICNAQGTYTEEYRRLVRDFYLWA